MFTSRAEYRLLLRFDNADTRLMDKGYRIGLLARPIYEAFQKKRRQIHGEIERLKRTRIRPPIFPKRAIEGFNALSDQTLDQILKRPEVDYQVIERISSAGKELSAEVKKRVEIEIKYDGYIQRQLREVDRFKRMEHCGIPEDFKYDSVVGLSTEVYEKLETIRPISIGQASRISGVTPAAISLLLVALERNRGDVRRAHRAANKAS